MKKLLLLVLPALGFLFVPIMDLPDPLIPQPQGQAAQSLLPSDFHFNPFKKEAEPKTETGTQDALPPDVPQDWYTQVQQSIADSEYEINWQEEKKVYSSPNRAQNLRFDYYDNGFLVTPRTEKTWEVKMTLASFGKEDMIPFTPQQFTATKNKAKSEGHNIMVTYENTKEGMRQDFLVREKPTGTGNLKLNIEVDSRLAFSVNADGRGIGFTDQDGQLRYRYAGLKVTDATGKELSAAMQKEDTNLSILVNDIDAQYPVLIDPLSTSADWTAEGNQANEGFSSSIASTGDVNGDGYSDVIVGATGYTNGQTAEGGAFVYYGSASGLSTSANWTAEGNQANAWFGSSVSSAGDVNGDGYSDVIVGATGYTNGQTAEGGAFVYYGSASGLSTSANWKVESDQAVAYFGQSVASAGDVNGDGYSDVIVGTISYGVFVYYGSASGLSASVNWTVESDQIGDYFGSSVASAGDVNGDGYSDVIVGAERYSNGQIEEGRAFVYQGSALGLSASADWISESNQYGANFGRSVSSVGDVNGDGYSDVIVGAPQYDNGQTNEGQADVYHGSASGLSIIPDWTVESDQANAFFGNSVSIAGDVNGDGYSDVIVGAYQFSNDQLSEGRAYVYHGSFSGLSSTTTMIAEGNQAYAYFGSIVANAGDVNGDGYSDVIVGAIGYDNERLGVGRAFMYHGGTSGLLLNTTSIVESDQAYASFGYSVNSAGDVNGDGYSDVIVGATWYDNGQTAGGRVFAYHGSASGLSPTPSWVVDGDKASAAFGNSIAPAGDVNGDGYSDVIVGAYLYTNDLTAEGRAYVYHGSINGLSSTAAWMAEGNGTEVQLGASVDSAGDVNGDGFSDIIIGVQMYSNDQFEEGRAYVYHGSSSGLSITPDWFAEGNQDGAIFGFSVSSADVNGDGYSDVIVGAPNYDNGQSFEGMAFVFHGSALGLSHTPSWSAESNQLGANFGGSVASAGDINGDGYSDVIVGAGGYDNGHTNEGRVYVYYGSASGLSVSANWIAEGDMTDAWFGIVSSAGDVNGDGYSDVIVGASGYNNGQINEGRAFVYLGSTSGLSTTAAWTAESDQASAWFGRRVSSAGDVNGDGYSDVIVGAHGYDNGQTDEGRAFVYYGNNGGVASKPRLLRDNLSTPIGLLGRSHSTSSVGAGLLAKSFMGRADVKAQFELKPLGTAFDGAGIVESNSWTDAGVSGTSLTQLLSGLSSGDRYKIRMRVKYSSAQSVQPYGRWLYLQGNGGLGETDFLVSNVDNSIEPTTEASNITFSNNLVSSINLQWTSGNGSSRIVVARAAQAITALPVEGKTYTGGAFGSGSQLSTGQYVVYNGTGNSTTVTGLSPATTYYFQVFEYSGANKLENYNAKSAANNPNSSFTLAGEPTTQTSNIVFSGVTITSMNLSWANGNGTERLVIGNAGSAVSSTPADGTAYTGNSDFGIATQLSAGEKILYRGNGNSVNITNLTANTVYHFQVFELNGTGAQTNYFTSTATGNPANKSTLFNEPTAQPTVATFSSINENSMAVSITAASGSPSGYLALVKAGSSPTDIPVDGTAYTAGSTIGASTVQYVGTSTSFTISGLAANTTYYVDIFSYNGTTGTYNYLTTAPLEGSQITATLAPVLNVSFGFGQTSFQLSWAAVTGATNYELDVSADNFSTYVSGYASTLLGNVTSTTVSNLLSGTNYQCHLRAINSAGPSANSNEQPALTKPGDPVVTNPSGIASNAFTINWNAVTGATGFLLDISIDNFTNTVAGYNALAVNGTSYTATGLNPATTYQVRLRSNNASGESGYSNIITVSTLDAAINQLKINTPPAVATRTIGFGSSPVTSNVSGGIGTRSVTMKYRNITGSAFTSIFATDKGNDTYEAVVQENMLDELGLEYYFEASDQGGSNVKQTGNSYLYNAITSATPNMSIPFAKGFNGKTSTYQMFSIPYQLDDKTIAGVFNEMGDYDKTKWRLYHYNGEKYQEHQAGLSNSIALGNGYWFNAMNDLAEPVQVGGGTVEQANQMAPFTLNFIQGWNQIGNPYPFNIDWPTIQSANGAAGLNSLWLYENGNYVKKDVLATWKGAFVFSDNGGTVSFPVLSKTTKQGRASQNGLPIALDEAVWQLPITLALNGLEQESAIGMHPEAKPSKDRFDEITVPRFIDYLEMNTLHNEFFAPKFSTDMVPTSKQQEWLFHLSSNQEGPATMQWDQNAIANSQAQLMLIDLTDGVWVDMKKAPGHSFEWKEGREIKIVYGREGEIKPGVTLLGQAYPNPFTNEVNIPVLVEKENETVEVHVYDLLGRKVKTLSRQFLHSGPDVIAWDGKDNQGNDARSGVLVYRTNNAYQAKRMIKK